MTASASPEDDALPFSELAVVAPNARVGENVKIGPFSVIGREGAEPVEIEDDTVIGEHVVIEPGARIGMGCTIEDHCRIGGGSQIAAHSRIRSGVPHSRDLRARRTAQTLAAAPGADAKVSPHALIGPNVKLGPGAEISPFAIVGLGDEDPVVIGAGTKIAPFALIEPGVTIGEDCEIDAYCRVGYRSRIGDNTKILYGAAVFEEAIIGSACIIGGNVADRTVIEDFVTHFGEIAHAYRDPGDIADWDGKPAPSPTILTRSVVAQNAIIIGAPTIGPSSYIGAGEVVKVRVPEGMLYQRGTMIEISRMHGLVRTRTDELDP